MNIQAVRRWWRALQPDEATGGSGDRAAAARLRRCETIAAAMQEPATQALHRRLQAERRDLSHVALLAAVLASVRRDAPGAGVARSLGPANPEDLTTAAMSPLRFRRLLDAATPDERLVQLRRMVALLDGTADVADLARGVLGWTERRRIDWTYAYWNAGRVAPAPTTGATP